MRAVLDAAALRRAMALYEESLREHRDEIDSLNVFPVPDGDTGTNLLLTQERVGAALATLDGAPGAHDPAVREAVARASLLGARGNSGVILSQVLRAICDRLGDTGGPSEVAAALEHAAAEAYRAVARPVEGTALTVLRDAADAALGAAGDGDDALATVAAALDAARSSLARTPDLLDDLRRAGVVDAGGKGIVLLLDALRAALDDGRLSEPVGAFGPAMRGDGPGARPGNDGTYEVQFLLRAPDDALAPLRSALGAMGDSLVVVGGAGMHNVHVHTPAPGRAIEVALEAGAIRDLSVVYLQGDGGTCVAGEAREVQEGELLPGTVCGLVAVAEGPGLIRAFRSLGATVVVGGPGNNPSVADLVGAAGRGPERVLLLPNHPNVLPAAERAVGVAEDRRLEVVKALSVPAGLSAAAAFNAAEPLEANAAAMGEAAAACGAGEVTRAVRDAATPVGPVRAGEWMGFVGGEAITLGASPVEVVVEVGRRLVEGASRAGAEPELATLIVGAGVGAGEARAVADALEAALPALEVQVVDGGQPRYPYLIGVE